MARLRVPSEAMGCSVPVLVWLPAGYQAGAHYPVWYGLHGYSTSETMWLQTAGAGETAERLIAAGLIRPLIMVFPLTRYDPTAVIVEDMKDGTRGETRMERFLCRELIPWIDQRYPTVATADNRWIGGFSMGGLFALQIALRHPGLFGKAAGYSPALVFRDFTGDRFERWLYDGADTQPTEPLEGFAASRGLDRLALYLDCGDETDPFSEGTRSLGLALAARGLQVECHPHPGGHALRPERVEEYLRFFAGP
ncbi:MAG: esterase family protein [Clostridiales bacterium]|nr:esterase family protein [Clostridiales bacterium]